MSLSLVNVASGKQSLMSKVLKDPLHFFLFVDFFNCFKTFVFSYSQFHLNLNGVNNLEHVLNKIRYLQFLILLYQLEYLEDKCTPNQKRFAVSRRPINTTTGPLFSSGLNLIDFISNLFNSNVINLY